MCTHADCGFSEFASEDLRMINPVLAPSHTSAGLPVWLQAVPSGAGAQVAALGVLTQEVTRLRRQGALVHIWNRQKKQQE